MLGRANKQTNKQGAKTGNALFRDPEPTERRLRFNGIKRPFLQPRAMPRLRMFWRGRYRIRGMPCRAIPRGGITPAADHQGRAARGALLQLSFDCARMRARLRLRHRQSDRNRVRATLHVHRRARNSGLHRRLRWVGAADPPWIRRDRRAPAGRVRESGAARGRVRSTCARVEGVGVHLRRFERLHTCRAESRRVEGGREGGPWTTGSSTRE